MLYGHYEGKQVWCWFARSRKTNRKEIEVEAKNYGIENYESCIYNDVKGWETDIKVREQSFIDGAEFVYKEIAKLKEDVEYWKNEYYYLKANPKEV